MTKEAQEVVDENDEMPWDVEDEIHDLMHRKWTDYGKKFPPSVVKDCYESVNEMLTRMGVSPALGVDLEDEVEQNDAFESDEAHIPPQRFDKMDAQDYMDRMRDAIVESHKNAAKRASELNAKAWLDEKNRQAEEKQSNPAAE